MMQHQPVFLFFMPMNTAIKKLLHLLCLCVIIGPSISFAEYRLLDRIVAIAEDDVVLASEIREKLAVVKTNAARRNAPLPSDSVLYEQLMENLVIEKLQLQRAHDTGLRVSDQELNEAMRNIAAQNGLTLGNFREVLEQQGQSYQALREQTRNSILLTQVQQRSVMRNISISPSEVDNFLESESGKLLLEPEYSIDHILIPLGSNATDEAIQRAIQRSQRLKSMASRTGDFSDIADEITLAGGTHSPLGWRRGDDIPSIFSAQTDRLQVREISEPIRSDSGFHLIQIKQKRGGVAEHSTETLVRHILLAEKEIRSEQQSLELMDQIISQLNDGADFSELARKFSDDPGSALKGGDLGWTLPGVMVPEFDAVMRDTAIGEVSNKFKSQYGWHILYVVDRRSKDLAEENARRLARIEIAKTKYDDELNNWLQELRDNSYVEIK